MPEEAMNTLSNIESFFASFDLVIFAALSAALILYLFTIGKDHGVILTLSTYLSAATVTFLPFLHDVSFEFLPDYQFQILLFLLLIVLFAILQMRNGYFEPSVVPSGWEIIVFALLISGMIIFVAIGFMPTELQSEFSEITKTLFLRQPWSNLWFALPFFTLLFLKGDA